MSEQKLIGLPRTEFGKGAARRLRRESRIPAVMYGHGDTTTHLSLPGHETMMAFKHANALLDIEVNGKVQLALAKEVQRHPVTWDIEHVDLVEVKRGEKVEVEVYVQVTGEAAPGTVVGLEEQTLLISADASKLPEQIEVSVEGLEVGEHVLAEAVTLPAGVELVTDPEVLVVNISAERTAEEVEAELEEAEAEIAETKGEPEPTAEEAPVETAADSEESTESED
ncbi:50S ribosomal protein L25/general stress protein Ctc [Spelaeicoccus albus]|uniref:Large ribosomal subunit protein bL25 n=1 Tax=Spelaeicoccus albus TaxID=1280376 RepID=A0A7Z0D2X3_9MICO|nr:50S ribosomal protein L25/general stress protein Ctc [Spelaeicoccus albus]NYI67861.1 large subunit ribosomal protein L25 [Spelaeicoccus albus]